MGVSSELQACDGREPLLDEMKNGVIDVIPSLPAELRYEAKMDLSQFYYKSGLAIGIPAEGAGSKWLSVIAKIFSTDIWIAFGFLPWK